MEFKPSDPAGIGMEMEFQLLADRTLNLVDGILPLMDLLPDNAYVKPEFIQDTVEVASKVCYSLPELEQHVKRVVAELHTQCGKLEMCLCGAGTHPFNRRLATLTPQPRYLNMEKTMGYLSRIQITFATHVHIGMTSGDEAVLVMRELKPYLPLLIGLSANSPFWRGHETGYAAYRHRILAASRSYGNPPSFDTYSDFLRFCDITKRAGIFDSVNDIHWDIRPRPHLGSLEVRVMDAQPTVTDAVALAGLVRSLVTFLRMTAAADRPKGLPAALPWWLEKHNCFEASLRGLEARSIVDDSGTTISLQDQFCQLLEVLEPTAAALDQLGNLDQLHQRVTTGVGYVRQRREYQASGSFKRPVQSLVNDLRREMVGVTSGGVRF